MNFMLYPNELRSNFIGDMDCKYSMLKINFQIFFENYSSGSGFPSLLQLSYTTVLSIGPILERPLTASCNPWNVSKSNAQKHIVANNWIASVFPSSTIPWKATSKISAQSLTSGHCSLTSLSVCVACLITSFWAAFESSISSWD